jgi:hypothetical protein
MPQRLRWTSAILIGLAAAATGVVVLLAAGMLSGRGPSLIADAGARMLPHALAQGTGLTSAAAYLAVHTAFYLAAGLAAVILTRMADRVPATVTGLVIVMIMVEFGVLEFSTQALAQHRIDELTWRALLVAHAAADVVFALLVLRAHPSLRRDLVQGYEG